MPSWKCTIKFIHGIQGWSETYYRTDDTFDLAQAALTTLIGLRARILAVPAKMDTAEVTNTDSQRDVAPVPVAGYTQFDSTYGSDTPWQSDLVRLFSSNLYNRPLFIRGIPDLIYQQSPRTTAETTAYNQWYSYRRTFLNSLIGSGWQILCLLKAPENPIYDIVLIGAGAILNTLKITTRTTAAIGANAVVKVYARGFKPPIGRTVVESTDPTNNALQVYYFGTSPANPVRSGQIKLEVYGFKGITDWNGRGITHRIVGRPSGLQRGRRPVKVK